MRASLDRRQAATSRSRADADVAELTMAAPCESRVQFVDEYSDGLTTSSNLLLFAGVAVAAFLGYQWYQGR